MNHTPAGSQIRSERWNKPFLKLCTNPAPVFTSLPGVSCPTFQQICPFPISSPHRLKNTSPIMTLCSGSMRFLWVRLPRRVLLQRSGRLPLMQRQAHGRDSGSPGGSRHSPHARPPMGPLRSKTSEAVPPPPTPDRHSGPAYPTSSPPGHPQAGLSHRTGNVLYGRGQLPPSFRLVFEPAFSLSSLRRGRAL